LTFIGTSGTKVEQSDYKARNRNRQEAETPVKQKTKDIRSATFPVPSMAEGWRGRIVVYTTQIHEYPVTAIVDDELSI
jgi:hypothetical protein